MKKLNINILQVASFKWGIYWHYQNFVYN